MRRMWILTSLVAAGLTVVSAQGMGAGMPMGQGGAGAHEMPGMGMEVAFEDEVGFLQHMILHHEEALVSARQLLGITEREALLDFAREVIEVQRGEIERMRGWLETFYPERTEEIAYEPMMADLAGMSPDEAERSFLEGMIMHHMMAVRDARHLLVQGLAEHEEVAALAQAIFDAQRPEIAQMRAWLDAWFDGAATRGMMGQGAETRPHGMERDAADGGMMGRGHHGAGNMGAEDMGAGDMGAGDMGAEHMGAGHMGAEHMGRGMMDDARMHRGMAAMHGMMGDGAMGRGMMGAHEMMSACMAMMARHGAAGPHGMLGMHGMPGMPGMHMHGMNGAAEGPQGLRAAGYGGVEALARAFLAGRGVEAEIAAVEPPRSVYRVTYRDGDAEGVLLVDAETGEVWQEAATE